MGFKKDNTVEKMFMHNRMKSQNSNQSNYKERAITFYTRIFRQIIKQYQRKKYLTSILIVVECMQIMSLIYDEDVVISIEDNIDSKQKQFIKNRVNQISQWFKYFRIYPLLLDIQSNDNSSKEAVYFNFSVICSTINLVLFGYIFLRFLVWFFVEFSDSESSRENNIKDGSQYSTVNTMIEQRQSSIWNFPDTVSSLILQCYSYIIAIPFSDFSINILYSSITTLESIQISKDTKVLGVIALVTTLTLWIIVLCHDFDFSIQENDYLAQRKNLYQSFCFIFNIIFCGLRYGKIGGTALAWIGLVFCFLRIIIYYKDFPYSFIYAQKAIMLQNSYIFINSLVCVVSVTIINQEYSFIFFLSIPLGFKLSEILFQLKDREILPYMQGYLKNDDLSLTNRYIRYLINLTSLSYEQYLSSEQGYGVAFETLYSNHIFNCYDETCFCIKYVKDYSLEQAASIESRKFSYGKNSKSAQNKNSNYNIFNGLTVLEMHGIQYRRQFIIDYLNSIFGKLFNFGSNTSFQFNYNILQKEESINGNNASNSNLGTTTTGFKQKTIGNMIAGMKKFNKEFIDSNIIQIRAIYIYYLMHIAQTPAKAFTQIFELREAMLKDKMSLQSKYIVQSLVFDTFDSFYHFFCMPEYQNQRLALTQLIEFDYLIKDLKKSMLEGLLKRQHYYEYLYSDFIVLTQLVRQSEECIIQKDIVEQQILRLFDICPNHPKTFIFADIYIEYFDFKKRRIRNFMTRSQKVMNYLLRKTDRRIDLFGIKSCALFISFRNSLISKATFSSANVFQCQLTDLLNKPFNLLLPEFMIKHTNKYLQSLNEDGDMQWIQLGEYFSFVKNSRGYIIPVFIRSKLDIVDGNDFGLTIYIQPSNQKKEYIVCDSQFQYLDSTKNITRILTKSINGENKSSQNFNDKNKPIQAHLKNNIRQVILFLKNFFKLSLNLSRIIITHKIQQILKQYIEQQNPTLKFNFFKQLGLLKQINLRNIIPFLLSVNEYDEINDIKDYNENLGFKDQQTRHLNAYTSILAIPVNPKQVVEFGNKVRLDAYEIDKYFCTYPSDQLQFLEITFSVLRQKSYFEPEKYIHFIEISQIRRFRKQAEINEYISFLNDKLTKLYQSPIQIPQLQKSTFYYRPPKPQTVMMLKQVEDSQSQNDNQESITDINSPVKSNSHINFSEGYKDFNQAFDNSGQKISNKDQALKDEQNKKNPEYNVYAQNQEHLMMNTFTPRGIIDLNNLNITNFDQLLGNQYNQIQMSNIQMASSYNQLLFSPRSDERNLIGKHISSDVNIQNSIRETFIQDNHARQEEEYFNQLLNQTQLHQQIHNEIINHVNSDQLIQNQQNQNAQESDERTYQFSNTVTQ